MQGRLRAILLKRNKKRRFSKAAFFKALRALDLAGAQATGAYVNGRVRTVNDCLHLADVGLPSSVGLAVGVGYVVTEGHALAANAAICHFDTS